MRVNCKYTYVYFYMLVFTLFYSSFTPFYSSLHHVFTLFYSSFTLFYSSLPIAKPVISILPELVKPLNLSSFFKTIKTTTVPVVTKVVVLFKLYLIIINYKRLLRN